MPSSKYLEAYSVIKEEHSLIRLSTTQNDAGASQPTPRRQYRRANERLKNVVEAAEGEDEQSGRLKWETFSNVEIYEYLLNVSANLCYI
jgi:hypothetical protein